MESADLHLDNLPRTLELVSEGGFVQLRFIDQRKLPAHLAMIETDSWRAVVDAIKTLAVRGAPAIGVAGVAALALWAVENAGDIVVDDVYCARFAAAADAIATARPTAVNLAWGIDRARAHVAPLFEDPAITADALAQALFSLVKTMEREDEATNRAIGRAGASLLQPGSRVLTHCNAGSLATCFYGTALGVVYAAAAQGKIERVFADETRPVGQGARLTVWELARAGVPTTLLCDNMAASLMAQGAIDAVIVGADRITRNGDVANKIGTYGVAVLARHHGIPFYVAAPFSTIDPALADGSQIPIEQRNVQEVLPTPLSGVEVLNPAFDVTPASLVSAFVTEQGVIEPSQLAERL